MVITPQIKETVEKSLEICNELNIPYSQHIDSICINNRLSKKWGYCRRYLKQDGEIHFNISIAGRLIKDDVKEKKLLSVILHEILHTCPQCFNHGKQWKEYKKQIKKEKHIKIYEVASSDDMKVESNYFIKCRNCKIKYAYAMRPRNTHGSCSYCGSRKLTCYQKEKGKEKEILWKEG